MAALRPFHVEGAAVTDDAQAAVDDAPQDRGHGGAGGARARGAGVADTALPETYAQLGPRRAGHELEVRALREEGGAFQGRAEAVHELAYTRSTEGPTPLRV